jgi:hypothetical protein
MHNFISYITIFAAIFMSFNLVTVMYEAYIVKVLSKFASIVPVQMITALLWSSVVVNNVWAMSSALLAGFIFIIVKIWNTPLSEDDEFEIWKDKCTEKAEDPGKFYLKADKTCGTFNIEQLKTQFKDYKDKESDVIEEIWNMAYNGNGNFDNFRDDFRKKFFTYKKSK